eukprot:SAG31_NODE_199_length_20573_cov_5.832129_18_plen_66_part_00
MLILALFPRPFFPNIILIFVILQNSYVGLPGRAPSEPKPRDPLGSAGAAEAPPPIGGESSKRLLR